MTTYKLFRIKNGKLFPLFVEANNEVPLGSYLKANVGPLADEKHVKSRLGPLSLRPGWHSCTVPYTNWIGVKGTDGKLYQRKNTVWAECEVDGSQVEVKERNGLRTIPNDWYFFNTQAKQPFPWIISNGITVKRILGRDEVEAICRENGVEAQEMET